MYGLLGYDYIWLSIFGWIWGWKKKKIAFKIIQIKFLAMHITNQKWSWHLQ